MPGSYRVERWSQFLAPNPAMLRQSLTLEGYEVFQWCDQPGTVYGPHKHDDEQSHWVVSGSIELIVQGAGTVLLSAGDRDYMPAGTYHSARVVGDEPVLYLIGSKHAQAEPQRRRKRNARRR
jgi:quercetin dioxygenase-like cupin family protein